jgi:hypothetical protein
VDQDKIQKTTQEKGKRSGDQDKIMKKKWGPATEDKSLTKENRREEKNH